MLHSKNLKKSALLFVLFVSLFSSVFAQPFEKTPRLVVNILVKDLQTNQVTAFYDKLGDNGLKKILKDGSYFPNASFDHVATFEGGNIATLVTGTQPAVHGLIGGSWYNPIRGNQEWALGADINNLNDSISRCKLTTKNILCSTVSDELLIINSKQAKVASIGIDVTEALITSGHSSQYQFWYNNNNQFTQINHAPGTSVSPGNCAEGLRASCPSTDDYYFKPGASILQLYANYYFIAPSKTANSGNSLWTCSIENQTVGNVECAELINSVENMQVEYGVDTDSDQSANAYLDAGSVTNWANVLSVRINLLLATPPSAGNLSSTAQTYKFNSQTITAQDRRVRRTYSSVINMRNRTK